MIKLPPCQYAVTGDINNFGKYTEAQLKQYGRDLLEEAAKACQNMKRDCGEPDSMQASLNRQMMSCADAIRALIKEIE